MGANADGGTESEQQNEDLRPQAKQDDECQDLDGVYKIPD